MRTPTWPAFSRRRRRKDGPFPALLHCYTGGLDLAQRSLALGHYVSFSGVITFKNSQDLRAIAAAVPLDRLLVETDSPFLAPVPHRGKRNEPAFVAETAKVLADVKGVSGTRDGRDHDGQCAAVIFEAAAKRSATRGIRMSLTLTILGCGSSGGVPRIGGNWGACDPENPKNRRRRASVLIQRKGEGEGGEKGKTNVLIDSSPDVREQMLSAGVGLLDAVVYTHDHADHTHGIDDLRMAAFNAKRKVSVYFDEPTRASLTSRFSYCFESRPGSDYPPILRGARHSHRPLHRCDRQGRRHRNLAVGAGARRHPVAGNARRQGRLLLGCQQLPAGNAASTAWARCADHRRLALYPAPSHLTVRQALSWIERIRPKRAILTHLHIDLDYAALSKELPSHVEPAYDGMTVDIAMPHT